MMVSVNVELEKSMYFLKTLEKGYQNGVLSNINLKKRKTTNFNQKYVKFFKIIKRHIQGWQIS